MLSEQLYFVSLGLFILGSLLPVFTKGSAKATNYLAHGLATLGCVVTIVLAISVLLTGKHTVAFSLGAPIGLIKARLDYLAAYFLLAFGIVGAAASVYAIGYSREYYTRRIALMAALYNAFLLSIALVLTISQVLAFVIVWELMTVISFCLVNHEYEKMGNTDAAYLYILMTHIGTAFIGIAFLLLASASNTLDFELLNTGAMTETLRNIVFICALIGFGTKAGVIPLHIWLPEAHPAAPSHVSAIMSGIMIKTAIYGMSRFFLEFLGTGPEWWGQLVLLLAIITSVFGVLYALMEQDLKRLLAYSSVENIGIILLGVGAGMVFMSKGLPVLAALAWAASFYHMFNHAIFKSLLFMGAGAVLHATHTKDIEHLGGLIKKMPYTAIFFLVGAVSISALPPLSGFVSEWLTFQALFFLPQAVGGIFGKLWAVILIALLGLTGALAGACFVKAFGVTFLAKPRSKNAEQATEVPGTMLAAMSALSLICVAAGVWPQGLLAIIQKVLSGYDGIAAASLLQNSAWYAVAFQAHQAGGVLAMPVVVIAIVAGFCIALVFARLAGSPEIKAGETWTCGNIPNSRMEYTATGFAEPIRRAFGKILHPVNEVIADKSRNPYHGVTMTIHVRITHYVNELMYKPVSNALYTFANYLRRIQAGSLQLYIGYLMAVTVIVLIIGTRW